MSLFCSVDLSTILVHGTMISSLGMGGQGLQGQRFVEIDGRSRKGRSSGNQSQCRTRGDLSLGLYFRLCTHQINLHSNSPSFSSLSPLFVTVSFSVMFLHIDSTGDDSTGQRGEYRERSSECLTWTLDGWIPCFPFLHRVLYRQY